MKNKIAVVVQCRLSSTRFPEKAIKILGNKTVLAWVLNSMRKIKADRYFVATDEASYEVLKPICDENNFECFVGSLENVLDRFCKLIEKIDVDVVVRATADNPYLFYEAAQASLDLFLQYRTEKHTCDYLTFTGLPHGSGVEIIDAKSLLKAAEQTDLSYDKEHVGPALYNHTENFNCKFVNAPKRFNYPELRTTIDTYTDYLRAIYICEYIKNNKIAKNIDKSRDFSSEPFSTEEILGALDSTYVNHPVILCPSVKKGCGTGHLHRCLQIAIDKKYFIFIPENSTLAEINEILNLYRKNGLQNWQIISILPDDSYKPVIITDEFKLTEEKLDLYKNAYSILSMDEGSDFSKICDYLLDIIPSTNLDRKANCTDSNFIKKPQKISTERKNPEEFENILICLGGEDPAGFTFDTARAFSNYFNKAKITAIVSESNYAELQALKNDDKCNIDFVKTIPELREKLYNFNLVVTHYGLTAFEASYAGCGVILLPTTKLHKQLSEKYGFVCLSEKITNEEIFTAINSEKLYPETFFGTENKSLSDFISKIAEGQKLCCPVCQKYSVNDEIVSRNLSRTYRRCSNCSIIYISWSMDEKKEYSKSYFFEDYKKQYGKTYKEDFNSIKEQGKKRLNVIKSLTSLNTKNILDIGCAYGPFLSAAKEYELNPFGTDISADAVEYVQNELHFPSTVAAFPEIDVEQEFGIANFDIVTMWYVIEHFKNLDSVLTKVSKILKKGGIFAFSTPSAQGISARSDWDLFFQNSPTDHYSVWEPSKANNVLNRYGFTVEKIVSTGHHPERFPSIKKAGSEKGSLRWNITNKISHIKKLGDTVEIYCRKK